MLVLEILRWFFYGLSIIATLASLVRWDDWWVRIFDFPRKQIVVIHLVALALCLYPVSPGNDMSFVFLVSLIISITYQFVKIYPYTIFSKKEVSKYRGNADDNEISLLISNVLKTNHQSERLIHLVSRYQPDILLTLESDRWWEDQLKTLETDFPYTVKVPLDNLYGMHLYSRLPLEDVSILYLVENDIPSIHAKVKIRSGDLIQLHCLHPEPPSPTEASTSTARDAELLIVGKSVKEEPGPVLVLGDLNDVAWSRTTKLFQKISGLLDPRIGRGFFNTFHADYWFLRWPLDHVFVSEEFQLRTLKVLPHIGSDHFPVFMHLHLNPPAAHLNESQQEEIQQEDKEWADEKIEKADPNIESL